MQRVTRGLELQGLARQCRADFEAGRVSNDELVELYGKYLPEQTFGLRLFLDHERGRFPANNCQPATVYLRHKVGYGEIDDGQYLVGNTLRPHTFLNVGQTVMALETIVDYTADQFGGPAVYTGPIMEPWISGMGVSLR